MEQYDAHPAADIMPPLSDKEYQDMVESIKADGLLYPIKLIGNLIIDGNHRYAACNDAGVEPRFEQVDTDNPVRYVLSCDTRRHLSTTQRAAIAVDLANMEREDTLKQNKTDGSNDLSRISINDAAELMGVSPSSVKRAKKVKKEDPEAHEAAKKGEKPAPKKKPTPKPEQKFMKQAEAAVAMSIAEKAISFLFEIEPNSEGSAEALKKVMSFCRNQLKKEN